MQHRIAGHQRRGVPIGTEAEVKPVEHGRITAFALERPRVLSRREVEIRGFDRHRQYLVWTQRSVFQQTGFEMCQIPVCRRLQARPVRRPEVSLPLATESATPASARSITHGVWPPLTANRNRPRGSIASLARAAITCAALFCHGVRGLQNFHVDITHGWSFLLRRRSYAACFSGAFSRCPPN